MSELKKLSKKELQEKAVEIGFFKKESVKAVYARTNGRFYYVKPPVIVDGHDTYLIKADSKEATVKGAAELVIEIKAIETKEDYEAFVNGEGFDENESRATVLKALADKQTELNA